MSVQAEPMRPVFAHAETAELTERLDSAIQRLQVPGSPSGDADRWEMGVPHEWLSDLLGAWRRFDVAAFQDRLDALHHLRVTIDGLALHVIQARGHGPAPVPLLLTHGWPGSCLEYLNLIAPLTDPAVHGGHPGHAFDVIIPSLPGYGWSAPPPYGGFTAAQVAVLWHRLMTEGLGYRRYAAHGSDLGAGVTAWLARSYPDAVLGIHLASPGLPRPPQPWSPQERLHFDEVERWNIEEGGYAHQHATKPATLAAALLDSPVGLAAWIGEKIAAWSSQHPSGEPDFDRDLLLGTLTLYWATRTIGTSLLPYWAYRHHPNTALPADDPPPVPTAVTVFGGEAIPFPKPPRQLAERYFTVTAWAEHHTGGHFPAIAAPHLLASTLRNFFTAG